MEQFDNFEFDRRNQLGNGAFAIVFRGRYINNPRVPVAVKEFEKKKLNRTKDLLTKEIKILKQLSSLKHENLVSLLRCAETPRHVYLVMEYCNGGDLMEYLHDKMTLEEDNIQHFLVQIARGLEAMNKKGIVHRDLKPPNILLCKKSNIPHFSEIIVKIADFGFARCLTDGCMTATVCGSPMYMAPEVIMHMEYDAKADLWSVGAIIFQCLTGVGPFMARTQELLRNFYAKSDRLNPNIPKECSDNLRDLLLKLLKRNPRDRISFDEFFNHSFLTDPVMITPSKRILDEAAAAAQVSSQKIVIPQSPVQRNPVRRVVEAPLAQQKVYNAPAPPQTPQINVKPLSKFQDNEDFEFLPPRQPAVKRIQPRHTVLTPLKPPVPVPSQRMTYIKMKEQLEASLKPRTPSPVQEEPPKVVPQNVGPPKRTTLPDPNAGDIEKLALPKTTFVICERENGNTIQQPESPNYGASTYGAMPKPIRIPSPENDENTPKPKNPFLSGENQNFKALATPNLALELLDLPFASGSPEKFESCYSSLRNFSLNSNIITSPMRLGISMEQEDAPSKTPEEELLAKLRFVSELTEVLIHVAEQKNNPLASAMASRRRMLTTGAATNTSSPYRRAEQLVVYVRCLHMLSSALLLAQTNMANKVLRPTADVQLVLNQLNDKYHQCLTSSQELASLGLPDEDPAMAMISAERIMYKHAIDLCQAAALDELFGNPHLCSQRYQTAHMMLHTLAEQTNCDQDKIVLSRYRAAVEKRLRILEQQGFVKSVTV
ncbi:hypothetical protein CAEBREN_06907 [Caenorhabditis brenneri]|uniref:Protein kinase domain-containing protein n=1 Tax=Caenorhabditis brenneri TaxID=135651 RepID=G0N0X9_CAEBE|nr:hypothetical protein CAEBREN_06907 [Caenorhabditis brenneri]